MVAPFSSSSPNPVQSRTAQPAKRQVHFGANAADEAQIREKLRTQINERAAKQKVQAPPKTAEQQASYEKILQQAAKRIAQKDPNIKQPNNSAFYNDPSGYNHSQVVKPANISEQQKAFDTYAANIYEQQIQPAITKAEIALNQPVSAAQRLRNIAQTLFSLFQNDNSHTTTSESPKPPTPTPDDKKDTNPLENQDKKPESAAPKAPEVESETTPETQNPPGAYPADDDEIESIDIEDTKPQDSKGAAPKSPAPTSDSTPVESGESAEAVAETNETQDAKEADDKQPAQPTESTNTDNEKKADDKKDSILHGWKKTKATVGTALLAGGIALKMTLIGIVPGLIMAGAGAALLGWAGINWMSGGSGDDKKVESDSSEKGDKKDKKADEANAA